MNIIDFLSGLTLMNAMPHFVLGVWKGRMLSAFGFGNGKNIVYGVVNFALSLSLFTFHYGIAGIAKNSLYAGALVLLLIYFLTGRMWYFLFREKPDERTQPVE